MAWSVLLSCALVGCTKRSIEPPIVVTPAPALLNPSAEDIANPTLSQLPHATSRPLVTTQVVRGTGKFVGEAAAEPTTAQPGAYGDPVSLDFVNADVHDVIRSVLGDTLKLPYVIDPAAQGNITFQTGGRIQRSAVLSQLEEALRLGGLAIVETGGLYRVVPQAQAAREVQLSQGGESGFVARVITPRYVAATELAHLLEPLVPVGTTLRAEPGRNVLIVSGPSQDVDALLNNLNVFDVDVLRGMSTALLPLRTAAARDVAKDIDSLLASLGDTRQLVRVAPLDRLNALLVTSMRPDYIDRVRAWVAQLDKANDVAERRIFVYRVQNGRAANLASVLRKTFGLSGSDDQSDSATKSQQGAGSTSSATGSLDNNATGQPYSGNGPSNPLLGGLSGGSPSGGLGSAFGTAGGAQPGGRESGSDAVSSIRITADETNNALLILATQQEYSTIEAALRQLDIAPLQVMVEATVAEVTLTDQLSYGLQYYLKSGSIQALFAQTAGGSTTTPFSGFTYAAGLNAAAGAATGSNVILQLLQQLTTVRVLSSPNLMVVNNETARIEVGDQVPIATGSAVSTLSSTAPIVNSIEYRDTGVILKVTPRVNASGMVSLDVNEEVSSVSSTTTSSLNSPTISERQLNTTVSIRDGQTVALGGLISDSRTLGTNGIPYLQSIPGLGWLFGQKNNAITRTELIAILTPHVVRNALDAKLVTDELQRTLPLTIPTRTQAK